MVGYKSTGPLDSAATAFRSGLEAARRTGDERNEGVALNEIGDVLVAQGNLPEALTGRSRNWLREAGGSGPADKARGRGLCRLAPRNRRAMAGQENAVQNLDGFATLWYAFQLIFVKVEAVSHNGQNRKSEKFPVIFLVLRESALPSGG